MQVFLLPSECLCLFVCVAVGLLCVYTAVRLIRARLRVRGVVDESFPSCSSRQFSGSSPSCRRAQFSVTVSLNLIFVLVEAMLRSLFRRCSAFSSVHQQIIAPTPHQTHLRPRWAGVTCYVPRYIVHNYWCQRYHLKFHGFEFVNKYLKR